MSSLVNTASINFTVSAADLIASATSDKVLHTFEENDRLIRVPRSLSLKLTFGTVAYTVAAGTAGIGSNRYLLAPTLASHSNSFGGDKCLFFSMGRALDSTSKYAHGRTFFSVPVEGLLDSGVDQRRFCFPNLSDAVFQPGRFTFNLRSGVILTLGDGILTGTVDIDQYAVA